jgi:hypothetical protein
MFCIGDFSLDEIGGDGNQRYGYSIAIVESLTTDDAVAKFESHIKQIRERVPEMANVANILYIEDVLKFTQLPRTPVINRLQSSAGEFPASISKLKIGCSTHGFNRLIPVQSIIIQTTVRPLTVCRSRLETNTPADSDSWSTKGRQPC